MAQSRTYGGRTAAERADARREALLDAGLALFGTQGFRPCTIERLCAAAGVGTRAFYEHFTTREELLQAVYTRIVADLLTAVDAALAQAPTDLPARARAAVEAVVHGLLDDPRRARIVTVEVIGVSDDLERLRRGVIHAFADRLETEADALAGRGVLPHRDHSVLAVAMVGAIAETVADTVLSEDPAPPSRVVDDLTTMLVALGSGHSAPPP